MRWLAVLTISLFFLAAMAQAHDVDPDMVKSKYLVSNLSWIKSYSPKETAEFGPGNSTVCIGDKGKELVVLTWNGSATPWYMHDWLVCGRFHDDKQLFGLAIEEICGYKMFVSQHGGGMTASYIVVHNRSGLTVKSEWISDRYRIPSDKDLVMNIRVTANNLADIREIAAIQLGKIKKLFPEHPVFDETGTSPVPQILVGRHEWVSDNLSLEMLPFGNLTEVPIEVCWWRGQDSGSCDKSAINLSQKIDLYLPGIDGAVVSFGNDKLGVDKIYAAK